MTIRFSQWDEDALREAMLATPPARPNPPMPYAVNKKQLMQNRQRAELTTQRIDRIIRMLGGKHMSTTDVARELDVTASTALKLLNQSGARRVDRTMEGVIWTA